MTTYEKMYGVKPDILFLRTFGCKVYAFVEKQYRKKRNKTERIGVFLAFSRDSKTYIVGIPYIRKLKVIRTRNLKFNEEEMYNASNQANAIAGPSSDDNDEGKHKQDIAIEGVYNNDHSSNPSLDTLNETSTSWQPRNKRKSRTEEVSSFNT